MFTRDLFQVGDKKFHKVLVVLEARKTEDSIEDKPSLILMLKNGHCVALGGNSPVITYFPDWLSLSFFSGCSLDDYEASDPSDYELPEEWDTGELPLGPLG